MAARAIASGTISFGLVSIPVKVFTATSSQKVRFNMLEAATGARLKQQYVSTVSGELVERDQMVKGYEYARGQYVRLSEEELKGLESDRGGAIEIVEFVPLDTIDMLQVEKSYYLGPDKGGDKAYQLLGESMSRRDRVAVARWAARGKEQLVLIRPYREGLVLHQLFYAKEVRAFEDVDRGAALEFAEVERDLAEKLIDHLSVEHFESENFSDRYTDRVRELVDQKVAGHEISIAPEQPRAQIIDLFEALKQSLADGKVEAMAASDKGPKKAKPRAKVEPKPLKKARPRKSRRKKAVGDDD